MTLFILLKLPLSLSFDPSGYSFDESEEEDDVIFYTEEFLPPHLRSQDSEAHTFLLSFVQRILEKDMLISAIQSDVALVQSALRTPLKRWLFVDALCLKVMNEEALHMSNQAFECLSEVFWKFLAFAEKTGDLRTPFLLLTVSHSFRYSEKRGTEDSLRKRISDCGIWKNNRFWEIAFYDVVTLERMDREWNELSHSEFKNLPENEKTRIADEESDILCDILSRFGKLMSSIYLPFSVIRNFLNRMCDVIDLSYDRVTHLLDPYEEDHGLENDIALSICIHFWNILSEEREFLMSSPTMRPRGEEEEREERKSREEEKGERGEKGEKVERGERDRGEREREHEAVYAYMHDGRYKVGEAK